MRGLLGTGTAVGLAVAAILLGRQTVQRASGPEPGWNETVAMVLTVGGVVYGSTASTSP
ncbi:hypothetical protein ACWF82_12870 [Nocardia sp. NPDC055053]